MRWIIRQSNVLMRSLQSQIIILSFITLVFALLLGISETYSVKVLNYWLSEPAEGDVAPILKRLLKIHFIRSSTCSCGTVSILFIIT